MATDRDLELLDDYLSDKLQGTEKADFEKRLEADASLRNELALQRELIDGLKTVRVAELKSMLSQVPVPPASGSSMAGKLAMWVIAAAAVGLGSYYLWQQLDEPATTHEPVVATEDSGPEAGGQAEPAETAPVTEQAQEPDVEIQPQADEKVINREQTVRDDREKTPRESSPVIQPDVTPYDPTKELESSNGRPEPVDEPGDVHASSGSSIAVEVVDGGKKYDFHYEFRDGKLYLLGSFEKDLYEILEFFNDNKRTVFLYYSSGFYLLDETKSEPTPLRAITDPELLRKLRDYRDR